MHRMATYEMNKLKGETLDIIPMGNVDRSPLDYLVLGLKLRFGRTVEVLPELPMQYWKPTKHGVAQSHLSV